MEAILSIFLLEKYAMNIFYGELLQYKSGSSIKQIRDAWSTLKRVEALALKYASSFVLEELKRTGELEDFTREVRKLGQELESYVEFLLSNGIIYKLILNNRISRAREELEDLLLFSEAYQQEGLTDAVDRTTLISLCP